MKVQRTMENDQYQFCIEAHPLKVLYTKYNPDDIVSHYQCVRPLGRIRHERRSASNYKLLRTTSEIPNSAAGDGHSDMKLNSNKRSNMDRNKTKVSEQSLSSSDSREKDYNVFPSLTRSRTQAFENQYKIAASRANGQETPSPMLRPTKSFDKKVVHLPLFRINLKTYIGESEVNRTVAKTRESLRQLMDVNKSKMKNGHVANIKNYEFCAPKSVSNLVREGEMSAKPLVSQPFHAKPALKPSRAFEFKGKQNVAKAPLKFGAIEYTNHEADDISTGKDATDVRKVHGRFPSETIGPDDEPDDSMMSLAIRPDTSLTLGTTMHHIDRVIKSPTSEEMKELSEAFKCSDVQSAWPVADEMQTLFAPSQPPSRRNRTPFSRPTTVLRELYECPEEDLYSNHLVNQHRYCTGASYEQKPVLRYTSKQSSYKLDPIIVPSHTCTDCPMCNIYQREVETPCPPNTPNTGQFMPDPGNQPTPVFVRGTRITSMHSRPEVMHITRINMNGSSTPPDDQIVLNYV